MLCREAIRWKRYFNECAVTDLCFSLYSRGESEKTRLKALVKEACDTNKSICDATKSTEILVCLSCESRAKVDELVQKAIAAGGLTPRIPQDQGFMYGHGFEDLDGHIWELIYMEPGK